jgi:hypothetical protein
MIKITMRYLLKSKLLEICLFLTILIVAAVSFFQPAYVAASTIAASLATSNLTNGLISYWTFDGKDTAWTSSTAATVNDRSNNGYTLTLNNMSESTSPIAGKIGEALNFNSSSTNQYASTGVSLVGTNTVSICGWIKPSGWGGNNRGYIFSANGDGGLSFVVFIGSSFLSSTNTVYMDSSAGSDSGANSLIAPSGSISLNTWQYICVTRYTSGSGVIYINGTQVASGTTGTPYSDSDFDIGNRTSDLHRGFTGIIDDVRVYNRALSSSEVLQLYNMGSTKYDVTSKLSLVSGLEADWTFDGKDTTWTSSTAGTTNDVSGSGNTGTLTNMSQSTSPVSGKIGQAFNFNGTNYIDAGRGASLQVTHTGSVSAWVKTLSGSDSYIAGIGSWSNHDNGYSLHMGCDATSDVTAIELELDQAGLSSGVGYACSSGGYNDGKWHLAVATWDGSTVHMYVDGVLNDYNITSQTGDPVDNNDFMIGIDPEASGLNFNGSIDDVRVYKRALSAAEVQQLYNMGSAKYDVTPERSDTLNLVGYWTFDGRDAAWTSRTTGTTNDVSGSGNNGTMNHMNQLTSPAEGKIGQALLFNGSNTNVTISNPISNFSSAFPTSACAWIQPSSPTSGNQAILNFYQDSSDYLNMGVSVSGQNLYVQYDVAGTKYGQHTTGTSNLYKKWNQFCYTWGGSSIKLYLNAVLQTSSAITNLPAQSTSMIGQQGQFGGLNFSGVIDDVRVWSSALSASAIAQVYNNGK